MEETIYDQTYLDFRQNILDLKRQDIQNIQDDAPEHPIYAAVVDMNTGNVTASLACIADGTASLYYSNGDGMLGLSEKSDEVFNATLAFLYSAEQVLDALELAEDFSLPEPHLHNIYLISEDGIYKQQIGIQDIPTYPREVQFLNFLYQNVLSKINIMRDEKE